ncbi:MAG: anthranilate/aminodeoxychorismate synthase component II [Candidatus Altiarchaeales archaeon]|nr:MAG: anthranilate/aminodeoxychorismate synthase component II [Candidatus Altiarchaeales archaeon]RLI94259.1 MAG: anthranilate/aminodeoxychorismate synthase component II [Candidatus Altiarchaeales archaeon]
MSVLVIDNIDSFVYNLVQYVGILGKSPIVVKNNEDLSAINEIIEENSITHIIISPGPKRPEDAGISNEIIEKFYKRIPILGICLGHQCIGYVFGAKIRNAKILMHGKTSLIEHNDDEIFNGLENPIIGTRYHSLVVDGEDFPRSLKIIAVSMDDNEIMGIRHRDFPVYGLQFHPESILTKNGIKIIENFLRC